MGLARTWAGTIYDFLAPPLILITPFISFIKYNDYSYAAPEFWICVAGLVAIGLLCGTIIARGGIWLRVLGTAGLLTLFVDLQFDWFDSLPHLPIPAFGIGMLFLCWLVREHLSRITAPVFATMLATGLLFQNSSSDGAVQVEPRRADAKLRPTPPVTIHLIFDAFIGIEGIPLEVAGGNAVRHSLRSFFLENGFRVFGRAYSRYDSTDDSISNILNYASVTQVGYFIKGIHKRLRKNQYFQDMYEKGYLFYVYQPGGHIDFCKGYEYLIAACHTFFSTGIKPLESLQLTTIVKSELVLRNFGRLSVIWQIGREYYRKIIYKGMTYGYFSRQWLPGLPVLFSASGLQMLDMVARDVANAAPGNVYFAHVPIPHFPYVYDRNCNLRNPHDWEDQDVRDPESRRHLYRLYLDQVECTYNRLRYIFELWRSAKVFDRAKVIIHGDHGSRLYLKQAHVGNKYRMEVSDYTDGFSTLLAVKAPGLEPKYDRRIVAIQDALGVVANNRSLDLLSARVERPFVLLLGKQGLPMIHWPLPHFGNLAPE